MSQSHRLATRILQGLLVGVLLGALTLWLGRSQPAWLDAARSFSTSVLDPVGRIFLHLLFFVVIPLVFASLALGVVQLGRLDRLGPLAGRTFALFAANMRMADEKVIVRSSLQDASNDRSDIAMRDGDALSIQFDVRKVIEALQPE